MRQLVYSVGLKLFYMEKSVHLLINWVKNNTYARLPCRRAPFCGFFGKTRGGAKKKNSQKFAEFLVATVYNSNIDVCGDREKWLIYCENAVNLLVTKERFERKKKGEK